LETPPEVTRPFREITERPGTIIGPYKLMEQIGEGGFGLVFVAEQQQPIRRKVALKVVKPGMDTYEVIARFEAERQALALMDHPNIARVLDAGATESGRPYFVMELVHGVSITDYCDKHRLAPRERLGLFMNVCHAVQHAHQKGIIHRDIKPSNVLVTLHDDRPTVKVIDFGVAKAIGGQLTEQTIYTRFAQMIGTPLYMSPEQAEMSSQDIDTRSDIYALGVLLYELLTGTTPFDRRRLAKASFDEVRRIIREEEPPKPSTRLSESGDTLPSIAASRHTEPAQLSKLVRGDLDWIVMKSLEKDRKRRYETANGLARDVERYLADEPVEASPPTAAYRLRKFARKHKTALATTAAFLLLLVTGTVVSVWQAIRATEAQHLADQHLIDLTKANADTTKALDDTKQAKERTERALTESNEERRLAEAVSEFLVDAFRKPDPEKDGRALKVVDLLDQAVAKLDDEFVGSPRIKGELLEALGRTYSGLGLTAKALPVLEKARALLQTTLGPEHRETLVCVNNLATVYLDAGRPAEAQQLVEQTLKLQKAKLGPDDPDTLTSMNNLALAYERQGRRSESLPLYEETLKLRKSQLGPDHSQTLISMNNLGEAYRHAGRLNDALPLIDQTHKLLKAKFGLDHPRTVTSMNNLAASYVEAGQREKALPLLEEALRLTKARLGPDHPDTIASINNLAVAYRYEGRIAQAILLFEEALRFNRVKLGPDHPHTLATMVSLGGTYQLNREHARAEPLLRECLAIRDKKSPDDWLTNYTKCLLAGSLLGQKKFAEAEPLLVSGYEGLKQRESDIPAYAKSRLLTETLQHLVELYEGWGKSTQADSWRKKLPTK
jgi:serine/threonine protein kinase/Tfp pilus assembly protein PilF